jgi:hypothetical protein
MGLSDGRRTWKANGKFGAGLVVARQVARRDVAEEEAARDGIAVGSLSQRWYFIMKLLSDCR